MQTDGERRRYAQNVAVAQNGGEVVLEVFECDELFAPCIYGVCVPLESVVGAGEDVDEGGDGLGGRGGGVGGEGRQGSMGEREESGEVFGVFLLVVDEVRQEPRVGCAVDHVRVVAVVVKASCSVFTQHLDSGVTALSGLLNATLVVGIVPLSISQQS